MDALTLVDTFGVLSLQGASYYTKTVKAKISKPLEIHFHNDFGLAVANTIVAVLAGAEVIHSTVTGIGERAGNASMEDIALAFLTMYGTDVGLKYDKLNELSKLVRELSGTDIPANRPFIGDMAYDIESGIITSWYKNSFAQYPTEIFPVHPNFVGHRTPRILMGKKSGLDNVALWSDKLGIKLDEEEAVEVLKELKSKAIGLKRVLTEDEFEKIVQGVKAKLRGGK